MNSTSQLCIIPINYHKGDWLRCSMFSRSRDHCRIALSEESRLRTDFRATIFRPSEQNSAAEVVKKCHWIFDTECNIVACVPRRDAGAGRPWGLHHDSNRKGTVGVRPVHRRTCRAATAISAVESGLSLVDESSLLRETRRRVSVRASE